MKRLGLIHKYWRVTPAAMLHNVECTLAGITKCKGRCCCKSFWPGSAQPHRDGYCYYHTPQTGCTLTMEQRPIDCLLYPLKLKWTSDESATLIVHHRSRFAGVTCQLNIGRCRQPIIELFKPTFVHLLGQPVYDEMLALVHQGRNAYVKPRPEVVAATLNEQAWAADNQIPQPREG